MFRCIQCSLVLFLYLFFNMGCDSGSAVALDPLAIELSVPQLMGIAPLVVEVNVEITGGSPPFQIEWDFGDGTWAKGERVRHSYVLPGEYQLQVEVLDALDQKQIQSQLVQVFKNEKPKAKISADQTMGVAPLVVGFEGGVTGGNPPFQYLWDFGDQDSNTGAIISHSFEKAGTYTVVLTVEDTDGDRDYESIQITVASNQKPVVELSASPSSGVEILEVRFFANVAGGNQPLTLYWDLDGDQKTDSIRPDPNWQYSSGIHLVSVEVVDADGDRSSDQVEIVVEKDEFPMLEVQASPTSGLAPLKVDFVCSVLGGNRPLRTQRWEFGDGQSSPLNKTTYTFTQPGQYVASCMVEDHDGDVAYKSIDIVVEEDLQPEVMLIASPESGLAPLEVAFDAQISGGNPPYWVSWDFGDQTRSYDEGPIHVYERIGSFPASVAVMDSDGDRASATKVISVGDSTPPSVSVTAKPMQGPAPLQVAFSCQAGGGNKPLSYYWSFGDGTQSTIQNPYHTYAGIGEFVAHCTVTDAYNQVVTGEIVVESLDPNLRPVIDSVGASNGWPFTDQTCAVSGQTQVQLMVAASDPNEPPDPLDYYWTFESIPSDSRVVFNNPTVRNPTFVPDVDGQYVIKIQVDDSRGGIATESLVITAQSGSHFRLLQVPQAPGLAGEVYADPLEVKLVTDCGLPVSQHDLRWKSSNGVVLDTSGPTDDQGLTRANVKIGCDLERPARFIPLIETSDIRDSNLAAFDIGVTVGQAHMLLVKPEYSVPVHDVAGAPNPMRVDVQVTDRCGNLTTGLDVNFDIHTTGSNHACFLDYCPERVDSAVGVKSLLQQSTQEGQVTFSFYGTKQEVVEIWCDNVSEPGLWTGGWSYLENLDFETWSGDFVSGSTDEYVDEWLWGELIDSPGPHSGWKSWATNLDADYRPNSSPSIRWLEREFELPCQSQPIHLSFFERHSLAEGALAFVSLDEPSSQKLPLALDPQSAFEGVVDGFVGYQGVRDWQRVRFDLTDYACQSPTIFFNLYLGDTDATSFGWAIDSLRLDYVAKRALGSFVSGPFWQGSLMPSSVGVANCPSAPASIYLDGADKWGNPLYFGRVQVGVEAVGDVEFVESQPGRIGLVRDDQVQVDLGLESWTDLWISNNEVESVELIMPNGTSQSTVSVDFVPVADLESDCSDNVDNDCNGLVDCDDLACQSEAVCLVELEANWHEASWEADVVSYKVMWCNLSNVPVAQPYQVSIYLFDNESEIPQYAGDTEGLVISRSYSAMQPWSCLDDVFVIDGLSPGVYYFWFVVDSDNDLIEVSKNNNVIGSAQELVIPVQ